MHTGDSITVAPAQTLLRPRVPGDARCVDGGALIGVDTGSSERPVRARPERARMIVIEMNPARLALIRPSVSRLPDREDRAKLAVGYTLD